MARDGVRMGGGHRTASQTRSGHHSATCELAETYDGGATLSPRRPCAKPMKFAWIL